MQHKSAYVAVVGAKPPLGNSNVPFTTQHPIDDASAAAVVVVASASATEYLQLSRQQPASALRAPLRPSGVATLQFASFVASQRPQTQQATIGGRRPAGVSGHGAPAVGSSTLFAGGSWARHESSTVGSSATLEDAGGRRPVTRGSIGSSAHHEAHHTAGGADRRRGFGSARGDVAPGGFENGFSGKVMATEDNTSAQVALAAHDERDGEAQRNEPFLRSPVDPALFQQSQQQQQRAIQRHSLPASGGSLLTPRDAASASERDRHRVELDVTWKRLQKANDTILDTQRQHNDSKRALARALLKICALEESAARTNLVAQELGERQDSLLLPLACTAWTHTCPPPVVEPPSIRDSDVLRALRSSEKLVSLLHDELRRRDATWDSRKFEHSRSQELVEAASGMTEDAQRIPRAFDALILRHAVMALSNRITGAKVNNNSIGTVAQLQLDVGVPARPSTQPGRKRRVASAAI